MVTFPFFYFFTEEMLTTRFFESNTNDFDEGYPVARVKKETLLEPS